MLFQDPSCSRRGLPFGHSSLSPCGVFSRAVKVLTSIFRKTLPPQCRTLCSSWASIVLFGFNPETVASSRSILTSFWVSILKPLLHPEASLHPFWFQSWNRCFIQKRPYILFGFNPETVASSRSVLTSFLVSILKPLLRPEASLHPLGFQSWNRCFIQKRPYIHVGFILKPLLILSSLP